MSLVFLRPLGPRLITAEYPTPKVVTITGELSREEREALTEQIEADFAIPADRQYYESGGAE